MPKKYTPAINIARTTNPSVIPNPRPTFAELLRPPPEFEGSADVWATGFVTLDGDELEEVGLGDVAIEDVKTMGVVSADATADDAKPKVLNMTEVDAVGWILTVENATDPLALLSSSPLL